MNVGRIGVIAVQDIVYNKLDWIFRELPTEDYGIDAEIEVNVPEAALAARSASACRSSSSGVNS